MIVTYEFLIYDVEAACVDDDSSDTMEENADDLDFIATGEEIMKEVEEAEESMRMEQTEQLLGEDWEMSDSSGSVFDDNNL